MTLDPPGFFLKRRVRFGEQGMHFKGNNDSNRYHHRRTNHHPSAVPRTVHRSTRWVAGPRRRRSGPALWRFNDLGLRRQLRRLLRKGLNRRGWFRRLGRASDLQGTHQVGIIIAIYASMRERLHLLGACTGRGWWGLNLFYNLLVPTTFFSPPFPF